MGSFGDKFRTERERLGLTLDQVSNVTKISARMLKAIEAEHFDQLPGGVFNKGFIRAYAKHLGFNDEESISEYLVALRQAQIDRQTAAWHAENPQASALPPSKPVPAKPGRPSAKPGFTVPSDPPPAASISPRSAAPAAQPIPRGGNASTPISGRAGDDQPGRHRGDQERNDHEEDSHPHVESRGNIPARWVTAGNSTMVWRVAALILAVSVVAVALWNRHSRRAAAQERNSVVYDNSVTQPANSSSRVVAAAPSTSASVIPTPATKPQSSATEEDDLSASPAALLSRSAAKAIVKTGATAPALNLGIRASENCWISFTIDGETTSRETLIAPAHTSIRANHEIVVRVGNAAGVTFLLNGKEFPAQGGEAEVKTFTFDATGMRAANTTSLPDPAR